MSIARELWWDLRIPIFKKTVYSVFFKIITKNRKGLNKVTLVGNLGNDPTIQRLETDIRYIQHLLGHASSKTTEIYTHVTTKSFDQIKSPMDKLDF